MIPGRLTSLECLRTNDIADAVTREQNGAGELLLRVAGDVTADHSETDTEAQALEEAQPEPDQAAPFVVRGQTDQHRRADDADRVGHHHDDAARVGPAAAYEAADDQSQELNCAAGDLEVLRSERVEAEGADDDGGELFGQRRRTRNGNVQG